MPGPGWYSNEYTQDPFAYSNYQKLYRNSSEGNAIIVAWRQEHREEYLEYFKERHTREKEEYNAFRRLLYAIAHPEKKTRGRPRKA